MSGETYETIDGLHNPAAHKITTLIFDVDDTLYDVNTGFTYYRTGKAVQQFMVDFLYFPDLEAAQRLWEEYFERYHATAKALAVAEQEGRFPPLPPDVPPIQGPRFRTEDLSEYWATHLDFSLLGGIKTRFRQDLSECPLKMVTFSNAPRKYIQRVIEELGLSDLLGGDRLYAVDDVLPYAKPEKQAFEKVFQALGVKAEECIMVEDSMKNIRKAKELGMFTVLILGSGRSRRRNQELSTPTAPGTGEAIKSSDAPDENDPAVDVAIETVDELRAALPHLWQKGAGP